MGSCGVLDQSIQADKIIIPSSALRDEGTSYHYAPASDEVSYDETLLLTMENALNKSGIEHIRTKAWTTDAFYRETAAKVKRRLEAGAKVVDMEASAIMPGPNIDKPRFISFSTRLIMLIITIMSGMLDMKRGRTDAMTFFEIAVSIALELEKISIEKKKEYQWKIKNQKTKIKVRKIKTEDYRKKSTTCEVMEKRGLYLSCSS